MKKLLCIIALCCSTLSLFAWGAVGHRIVAQVAYDNLGCITRKKVDKLLGTRGIVYASSWADEIKSDTIYPQSYEWHFQNLRSGMSYAKLEALYNNNLADGPHLFYAMDSITNLLRKNPNNIDALKFLIHFAGDLGCPMHMGRPDDKGGNKVQMRWFGKGTNLHTIWDRWLIEYTELTYSEFAIYLEEQYGHKKKDIMEMTYFDVIYQTYAIQNAIYEYQELKDNNTYHYAYRFRNDLDISLYTAGIRLAQLLKELY